MKSLKFILLLPVLFMLSACILDGDGIDNGTVQLYNDTDRTVRVYYAEEDSDYNGAPIVIQKVVDIASGDDEIITLQNIFWDGEFTAVYAGILRVYDIDFNAVDYDSVHIVYEDFVSVVVTN